MASAISSLETTPFDRVLYLDTKSDKVRKKNIRKCSSDVCKRSSAFLPLAQLTRVREIFQVVVDSSQPKNLLAQTFSLRISHQDLGVWYYKCFGVLCDLVCSGLQIFQQKSLFFIFSISTFYVEWGEDENDACKPQGGGGKEKSSWRSRRYTQWKSCQENC